MSEIDIIIRTADKTKKAEITVEDSQTSGDIIQASIENWSLPSDTDYTIVNASKTPPENINTSTTLAKSGINSGDILEIQPVLVAGKK